MAAKKVISYRGFTVCELHKRLGKLIEDGHGRKYVNIDKSSFTHNCEGDGCVILPVHGMGVELIPMMSDDGATAWDSKGREKHLWICLLVGGDRANNVGDVLPRNT